MEFSTEEIRDGLREGTIVFCLPAAHENFTCQFLEEFSERILLNALRYDDFSLSDYGDAPSDRVELHDLNRVGAGLEFGRFVLRLVRKGRVVADYAADGAVVRSE